MSDLVKIEGMEDVIREFKKIESDVVKRREILKLLRRQAKPLVKAIRANTPMANKTVIRRLADGSKAAEYKPGNLKKSIQIKTSPSKNYPNVLVGPNVKKNAKYDGYYGFFIQYGTTTMAPNDFIWKASKPLLPEINTKGSVEMKKYIEKMIKKRTKL
tara:strand:+ start:3585 stop:4058 length:474 start_codon:yes stop_codon:yes gene_type:complete